MVPLPVSSRGIAGGNDYIFICDQSVAFQRIVTVGWFLWKTVLTCQIPDGYYHISIENDFYSQFVPGTWFVVAPRIIQMKTRFSFLHLLFKCSLFLLKNHFDVVQFFLINFRCVEIGELCANVLHTCSLSCLNAFLNSLYENQENSELFSQIVMAICSDEWEDTNA